ncbi:hypothetical protein [Pseudanabaena yagii]|uniref:Uncharacterized protein n=1 Tax=Pseudanabaena yagii GIHE-NHR1 TaxID=2722753 RepID=A0ABX1LMU6_9CYAN|nr:hypothetical protein [Pseudanabaena yagii]NMF57455.1 hypothetical protein [Pseudanabaena yagii GIHE-NHR1]
MNSQNLPEEGRFTLVTFPETQKILELVWWTEKGAFQGLFYYDNDPLTLYNGREFIEISASGGSLSRTSQPKKVKSIPCTQLVRDIVKRPAYFPEYFKNYSDLDGKFSLNLTISSNIAEADCPAEYFSIEKDCYNFNFEDKSCSYSYWVYTDTSI